MISAFSAALSPAAAGRLLALTDAVTHIDGYESVPDELWDSVEKHFGTQGAHDVLVSILAINTFNRLSITTRTNADAIKSTIEFDHDYDATL